MIANHVFNVLSLDFTYKGTEKITTFRTIGLQAEIRTWAIRICYNNDG
jgi:hypothetical protein